PAVSVSGPFGIGKTQAGALPDSGQLLPGAAVRMTAKLHGVAPAIRSTATVTITPLLADAAGSIAPLAPVKGSGHGWTIPWSLLFVVALVAAAAVVVLRRYAKKG